MAGVLIDVLRQANEEAGGAVPYTGMHLPDWIHHPCLAGGSSSSSSVQTAHGWPPCTALHYTAQRLPAHSLASLSCPALPALLQSFTTRR